MNQYKTRSPEETDELLDLLSSKYRRCVLSYLLNSSASVVPIHTLAAEIRENLPEDGQHPIIRLIHVELPPLAEAGVLDIDAKHNTVIYTGHPELEQLLGCIGDD